MNRNNSMKRQNKEEGVDLIALFGKLLGKWYLFAIALFIFISFAYVVNRVSQKVYSVSGILRYNTNVTKAEQILDQVGIRENNYNIEDEIIVITSADYIKETLDLLDFNISYHTKGDLTNRERHKSDFPIKVQITDSSAFQATETEFIVNALSDETFELTVKGKEVWLYNFIEDRYHERSVPELEITKQYRFGQPIREQFLNATVTLAGNPNKFGGDKLMFKFHTTSGLTRQYLGKLEVESGGRNSNILMLNINGSVVPKEVEFINTLMDVVIQKDLEKKNKENINTINFIDYQLANISDSLYKAERALESYQFSATSIGESGILYAKRDQLESQAADLNLKMSYLRNVMSNLESLEGVSNISAPSSVGIDDPLLSSLLIKLSELNQQRLQMGRTATAANPIIQRIDLEIASHRAAIRDNLEEAITSTNLAMSDINTRLRETNTTIGRLPGSEVRKLGVERKFQFSDNTYDLLLQRKAAAGIALATTVSDWQIVERARQMGGAPVSPKTNFIFLLAIFLGLTLPAVFVLVMDALNNNIKEKSDIEKLTDIPILGTVTKGKKYAKLVTEYDSRAPLLESLRSIRANLQYLTANREDHKIIGFTSSTSGEGKTFCAVNLGIIISQSGKKVLLIDADMRKSTMDRYFENVDSRIGLSSYLIGNSTLQEAIKSTKIGNLHVVLAGPTPPNPFELLNLPRLEMMFSELRQHYDYIIVDGPPLGLVSDYLLLNKHLDASIYVTRYNYTNKKFLENIDQMYREGKVRNISIILNDVKFGSLYGGVYQHKNLQEYYGHKTPGKKLSKVPA
jgi:capsular exopolysaccharide synthesis family protein